MKKAIISVMLTLAMLIAFTPTALCAEQVTLNALSDANAGDTVTISGTSSLSEVSIKVIKPDKTILFLDTVTPSGGTFSDTLTLPEDLATGAYSMTAGSGSTTATTTLSVTALPPIQLATPAKPALSYDLSTAMTTGGSYTVTVTALGAGRYVDSEASQKSSPQTIVIGVTGASLNAVGINLLIGNSQTLTAAVMPTDAANKAVTWSSSDAAVASVDANGKVTGVAVGTATITVTTEDGGFTASCTVTVSSSNGDSSSGGSGTSATSNYTADVKTDNGSETTLPVTVNKDAGTASIDVSSQTLSQGETVITIPSISDVDIYLVGIPVSELSTTDIQKTLTIRTEVGSVTVGSNMLTGVSGISKSKSQISIGQGNKSTLPADTKAAIGDRPLIQLTLSIDGKQTNWSKPDALVTVSIPYTPTETELENSESIVIWYIDGSGNAVSVPNGHFDPATGTVAFTNTHFSDFAVGYNKVSFKDVAAGAW
ncbi:MAG: Ig-like domain-containing protein [Anaerotignum sp.]|nr:Ig-like domain-containing protein [Anaerotignum sp.]